ncbi:hypothetical protein FRC09_020379 [Ceratobasidium sp. 395]|nr:hypothetical protein FRC09_020379 [Ceratobasidium sp. 395]
MPKSHPNKKYVESKSTELLLASQMIESSEVKAAKRPPPASVFYLRWLASDIDGPRTAAPPPTRRSTA